MKRLAILAVAIVAVLLGIVVWRVVAGGTSADFAALVPTGPIACPENPNDLSGIEGWAPGAGSASQMGSNNAGSAGGLAGALGGSAATEAPSPEASGCTGLSAALSTRFDAIDTDVKYIPATGFDPAARAETLADLDAAFAYVRDYIHTDAYAGSMRGAAGTLQARAGSPADKALLLAALLAAKQIPVRYAHATLAQPDIDAVIAAVLAPPAVEPAPDLAAAFTAMGLDAQSVAASRVAADKLQVRVRSEAASTVASAAAPTDALIALLAAKNLKLAGDDAALRAAWATNLRDHWWLQVQVNGAWVDYDPTLPGAKPGTHVGLAALADTPDDLPASLRATIDVRLVAQRLGAASPATLVERTSDAGDADASPILVVIGNRDAGAGGIASATSFVPSIGSSAGEQTGDAFGTDGLATVDLEIVVTQPGATPRLYRRSVLDRRDASGTRIDPAWTPARTAYALTTAIDVLPLSGNLDPGFAGVREVQGLRSVRAMMAYAAAGGNGKQSPPLAPQTYPMQALHYYEYDQVVRDSIEASGGVRFFYDRPQIAIERHGFDLRDGTPRAIAQFDIVENGMSATGSQPAAAVRANFSRGYVDELAEQHLYSAPNDGGTIALLDAARTAGVSIDVLQGEKYGGVAIAPSKAVTLNGKARVGWWQIDLQNGNLIGRMGPDGAGQELAEYAIARANDWSTLLSMIEFYGDFFRCIAGAVEAPLEGLQGAAQHWFQQCAGAAICSYMEALGSGEALTRAEWGDLRILLYNILDLSVTGSKDSWPPSGGSVCGKFFSSPLSNP